MVGHRSTHPVYFCTVCHLDGAHPDFLVGALAAGHLHHPRHRGHAPAPVSQTVHPGVSIAGTRCGFGVASLDFRLRYWDTESVLSLLRIRACCRRLPMGSMGDGGHRRCLRDSALAGERCRTPGTPRIFRGLPPPPPLAPVGIDVVELEPKRLFMRSVYLLVMGCLLGYLAERLKQLRAEVERANLARELHDGALQTLFAVEMQLGVLRRQMASQAVTVVQEELGRIQDLLLEEGRKLRELMQQMKPPDVDAKNLRAHLMEVVERFQRETGITARFVCESAVVALRPRVCNAVARIVQEGLVNVWKHSGASHVLVQVDRRNGDWQLTIDDDGRGFPFSGCFSQADLEADGRGPLVIKECVRLIDAQLRLDSIPGRGSRLEITISQK